MISSLSYIFYVSCKNMFIRYAQFVNAIAYIYKSFMYSILDFQENHNRYCFLKHIKA